MPLQEVRGIAVYYEAVIDVADTYEFVFTRGGESDYISTVTPPPPVNMTAPEEGIDISRAEQFDVIWDDNYPESSGINLVINGPCITMLARNIADNGQYTINADELTPNDSQDEDQSCSAEVMLTRVVQGELDANLKGSIHGRARDRVWFTTTP